jgi:D-3-phosphoglycerate dehydrogenase
MSQKPNILINLPPTYFTVPQLMAHFARLYEMGNVKTTSYNTPEEIAEDAKWADAIIMWAWPLLDDDLLAECKNLKFLGQIDSGQNQAAICVNRGLPLSNSRHGWSPSVAEMALTLILCGLRRVSEYHMKFRTNDESWVNDFPLDIDPRERQLAGRKVGIVGFGGIGQRLAELMKPFNVQISAYDPFLPDEVFGKFGAVSTELEKVCSENEIIVLCASPNASSHHLVNREMVESMQSGSLLVNVGRSWLIDMDALTERLQKGDMDAMLDVFETEPLESDSILRTLPNAFLTSHRAGGIYESLYRAITMLTDDLQAHLDGKPLKYQITANHIKGMAG